MSGTQAGPGKMGKCITVNDITTDTIIDIWPMTNVITQKIGVILYRVNHDPERMREYFYQCLGEKF